MPLSRFHPTVRAWFAERLGAPSPPQVRGWPLIASGRHTLIAAPTGSGKTLAAFLWALDALLREGSGSDSDSDSHSESAGLPDETRVLYVSPLKALSNDVRKNLQGPLEELRARDAALPEVRVLVRTGDTTQSERAHMRRRAPHILVTTPESLYILLTSEGGRAMLRSVRTVIVDEIHAVLGDKRGAHLALSLERLDALAGGVQRIGLSATQRPIEAVGRFLAGAGRECELVDEGHVRPLDVAVEIPPSPLEPVCSHETWEEIYAKVAALIEAHRSTLVFVGTRKLAERVGAQLAKRLGAEAVTCHHSSLSKERRLDAEQRLKAGALRALVATASLELGIDVGDVDLVVQIGATPSIATFLQRVGRAGHGVARVSKGRLFPLTPDELVESAALLRAVRRRGLERTAEARPALDILAQQIVAACAAEPWDEEELFQRVRRAWPYRELERETFDRVVALHTRGRGALLHRDATLGRLRGTRRARLSAMTSGGAIPDSTQYRVVLEPEGTLLGHLDEDFAIESSSGDVFQLGNASWRVLRVGGGVVRVADAHGAPPSLPFWVGEGPSRSAELSAEVCDVRERGVDEAWVADECGLDAAASAELARYVAEGRAALGATPTQARIVLERFFDESGGMQLVVHAPFGNRINRAFGLALRKRFCRRFGFELQAAADDDAIVLSLGPQHAFALEEVFDYLRPEGLEALLIQAVLPTPTFAARWRWNVSRALVVERFQGGRRVPPPLLRMRADDRLAEAFPGAVACAETLPAGDIEIPRGHPLVAQTLDDCLREAMDLEGLVALVRGLRDGSIERVAVDTPAPSPFARSVLAARPYGFLDDAPLEERRTQAVLARRTLSPREADTIGRLDPAAIARVREEAWPDPRDAEEVHEALCWMGYVRTAEAPLWEPWLRALAAERRVSEDAEGRWFATEASRDPKDVLRGRMEALGPVVPARDDLPLLHVLESEGAVLRVRVDGEEAWCDRRLLARIQRYTLDTLRREIEPVSAQDFLRFLAAWQHVDEDHRLEGPEGVRLAVAQLAGFEAPAAAWERRLLAPRVRDYRPEWLDQLTLAGEVAWGRLFGSSNAALRSAPISLFPRAELADWLALASPPDSEGLSGPAQRVLEALERRGALFAADLVRACELPGDAERGLLELVSRGLATSDSFASLRSLLLPAYRRRVPARGLGYGTGGKGRWSLLRDRSGAPGSTGAPVAAPEVSEASHAADFIAQVLLRRYGVIFRRLLERERVAVPWRDVARALRAAELRGEVRGGRFAAGYSGEQFALPEAVALLRRLRRRTARRAVSVAACDPLNLLGILTPGERVPAVGLGTVELLPRADAPAATVAEPAGLGRG